MPLFNEISKIEFGTEEGAHDPDVSIR
jgi:hypothetical protein